MSGSETRVHGTLALSWGRYGGFYVHRGEMWRVCLGRVALTYVPNEIDELIRAYVDNPAPKD